MENKEWLFSGIGVTVILLIFKIFTAKKPSSKEPRAGKVEISGDVSAGDANEGQGGDALVAGGRGKHGATGGDVKLGPGKYKAGDGGPGGKGGNLEIRGGDTD